MTQATAPDFRAGPGWLPWVATPAPIPAIPTYTTKPPSRGLPPRHGQVNADPQGRP